MWALAAAGALFWGLKIFTRPPAAPAQTQLAEPGAGLRGDLTRLLGVDPPPPAVAVQSEPPPDARFALIGVLSPRAAQAAREGVALIAVDGRPARAYRVGAVVDGDRVLKAVSARGAQLGPAEGPGVISLTVASPPPAPAATGQLPAASPDGAGPPQARSQPSGPPGAPAAALTGAPLAAAAGTRPVALPPGTVLPPVGQPQGARRHLPVRPPTSQPSQGPLVQEMAPVSPTSPEALAPNGAAGRMGGPLDSSKQ